jgi:hypothetical protein
MIEESGLKILTSKEFEVKIKSIMEKSHISMIESIIHYCEVNKLEIETAASLISPRMKSEIENEAINSRMIISKKARLPI